MAAIKAIEPTRLASQLARRTHLTLRTSSPAHLVHRSTAISQHFAKRLHTVHVPFNSVVSIQSNGFQTERWRSKTSSSQKNTRIFAHEQIQRRMFSRSTINGRDHHFDTLKFVQR